MILQPLFENAVKHGVYESTEPIRVELSCMEKKEGMEITIRNNFEPGPGSRKGAGIGLKNVKNRLMLIYSKDDLLKVEQKDNIFEVKLVIPQIKRNDYLCQALQ